MHGIIIIKLETNFVTYYYRVQYGFPYLTLNGLLMDPQRGTKRRGR